MTASQEREFRLISWQLERHGWPGPQWHVSAYRTPLPAADIFAPESVYWWWLETPNPDAGLRAMRAVLSLPPPPDDIADTPLYPPPRVGENAGSRHPMDAGSR